MRYVAAYLLASLGGNEEPSLKDIEKVLGAVGIDVDAERANKVINSLKGKNVEELIEKGKGLLASVPSGGAAVAVAASSSAAAAPAEEKKEAKKEESESEDEDMGLGLFD